MSVVCGSRVRIVMTDSVLLLGRSKCSLDVLHDGWLSETKERDQKEKVTVPVGNTQAIDFMYKSRVWAGAIEVDKKVVVSQTESATDGIQHHFREWRGPCTRFADGTLDSCPTSVRPVLSIDCQSWPDLSANLLVLVLNFDL